jgi:hypothetical protein
MENKIISTNVEIENLKKIKKLYILSVIGDLNLEYDDKLNLV